MKRVIWLVMDSFGIGNASDAEKFGDKGCDTFGNIAKNHKMSLPHLSSLGLVKAYEENNNKKISILNEQEPLKGSFYGAAKELSSGKDTLSGHWEMAGVLSDLDMTYYDKKIPVFPQDMINEIMKKGNINGILGNRHAGGIEIIDSLAQEHLNTGMPIFYTSADSVIQIAVHEEKFGLDRLYKLCEVVREVTAKYDIGRIIARPFLGNSESGFARTKNRKDYSLRATSETILEVAVKNNKEVVGIGKIYDIFGGYGVSKKCLAYGLEGLMDETLKQMNEVQSDAIIYTNFVDFDMEWGHRRDVQGYADGLEYFDTRLKEVIDSLKDDDLLIITADHGCDPTHEGSDHTRENVPVFGMLKNSNMDSIGIRNGFADMAASIEEFLELPNNKFGKSFL
ncbi:MAG: phosphopentomutase [Campylobacteraceae bacterium]|nr:phosphopentomutase [Campylobacteraceae bacterium]